MSDRHEEITTALPRDLDALPRMSGFRLRGLEMTRLEAFVDATFAFAVTMLVIAGQQVPDDATALLAAFRNVPVFAASIAVLAIFWRGHWLWSRRFGLEDGVSIFISWLMIFTMLVYVYPLKMIFAAMFSFLSGGRLGSPITVETFSQARALFALYVVGFTAISVEIILLNWRAWALRVPLKLNERERLMTSGEMQGWAIPAVIGVISFVLALTLPPSRLAWSGWIYFSMNLLVPLSRRLRRRRLAKLSGATTSC